MGQQFKVSNSPKSISPAQRWARRRNWEKRTLRGIYDELGFRLRQRWKALDNYRSQTATDEEIESMKHIMSLMNSLIEQWSHNHASMKRNINFKKFK